MRSVEVLNIANPEHACFMFDLAHICKDDFLNDADNDIILLMNEYEREIEKGATKAFITRVDGEKTGILWVEMNRYGTGRLRAGMLPKYRNGLGRYAWLFLTEFIDYCFLSLKLRKLDAEITLYGRHNRSSRAAEKLLRRFGFRKEGFIQEALMVHGKPKDTILFGLTYRSYREIKNNVEKTKQHARCA